jgi:hypothetical protein
MVAVGSHRWPLGTGAAYARLPMSRDEKDRRQPRPAKKSGTRLSLKLLRGTLASLRCRDLIQRGELQNAHLELIALDAALADISLLELDEDASREHALLRAQESKLRALLGGARSSRRGTGSR